MSGWNNLILRSFFIDILLEVIFATHPDSNSILALAISTFFEITGIPTPLIVFTGDFTRLIMIS